MQSDYLGKLKLSLRELNWTAFINFASYRNSILTFFETNELVKFFFLRRPSSFIRSAIVEFRAMLLLMSKREKTHT